MRNKKGITLIALVITIIVLLILVTVSIQAILGENGIVIQAKETKKNIEKEEIEEMANLIAMEYITENEGENATASYIISELVLRNYIKDSQVIDNGEGKEEGIIEVAGKQIIIKGDFIEKEENEYVDISKISIGDYVNNYPVQYVDISGSGLTGWRVLGKDIDVEGNICLKLTTTGVPLSYHHPFEKGAPEKSIENLTNNFLTTKVNSDAKVDYTFYECGFNIAPNMTLGTLFTNDYTQSVRSIFWSEAYVAINYGFDEMKWTWLPEKGNVVDMYCVDSFGNREVSDPGGFWDERTLNVRPVVILKSNVKFMEAKLQVDGVNTWEISY